MKKGKATRNFILGSIAFLMLAPFVQGLAATDEFQVRTLVGSDTTPPTVPSPFEAIPIATTQVNLSWGSSTDDLLLSGYHVWRDNVQVATTSNTFYADTGLLPSTTYTYYVTAFDSSFNESASSTAIATTTLSLPPEEPEGGSSFGSKSWFRDELVSLVVLPERDAVIIRYQTKSYIKSTIKWGETVSYELGSLLEHAHTQFHETRITGLTPATRYQFTIEGQDKVGKYGEIHRDEFFTLPAEDIFAPNNVSNLTALRAGDDIVLTWTNPTDVDFAKVRVLSNEHFYPSDTADGWVVYEGDGTRAIDRDVVQEGLFRYYTVFTYDERGNISSGAVVRVYLGDGEIPDEPELDPAADELSLDLRDFVFIQDGMRLPIEENGAVTINGSKQLSIAIPYERLPEHLKTILVILEDSTDSNRIFRFLLRVNHDKTAYVGTLAPFGVSGTFPIRASVFDFKTAQIGYADGVIISRILSAGPAPAEDSFWSALIQVVRDPYLFFGILILILLLYLSRRFLRRSA